MTAGKRDRAPPTVRRKAACRLNAHRSFFMTDGISSRIAVMYLGRIVELADSEALLENPIHPYTRALISAVPVPDPRARASRATIRGEPPNPFSPPSGCAFHARCPHADDQCRSQLPEFRPIGENHMVACHHAERLLQTKPA